MNNWIVLMIIDAFVISFSEVFKKKALKKNSTLEITAFFTGIAFIVNIFFSKDVCLSISRLVYTFSPPDSNTFLSIPKFSNSLYTAS